MIYRVVMDGNSIFAYTDELLLVSPSLEVGLNKAGSLSFNMPYNHLYYDLPKEMVSDVEVYEDDELIWYGRVAEISDTGMNRSKDIYCEGAFTFFNDTIQRPYKAETTTVHSYFSYLITRHNEYAPENRQFTVGTITVPNREISIDLDYSTTKAAVDDCLTSFGGYLWFRKENGVNYIDWYNDVETISPQPVQYALNLVNLSKYIKGGVIFTSIIPLGKEVNGAKVTIAPVNEGLDYLDNDELLDIYGRITTTVDWSSVSDPSELLLYAQRWLTTQQFSNLRIECEAAELYYLDHTYRPFRIGQLVHAHSDPHGVDVNLPIVSINANLDSPVKNISIGSNEGTDFTSMMSGGSSSSGYTASGSGGGGGGGGGHSITVDDEMSSISTNPVQNRVITSTIDGLFYECTQAEYDALPSTKLTDGVLYFITDTDSNPQIVILTQAEYNALPETKLTDGVYYCITDA